MKNLMLVLVASLSVTSIAQDTRPRRPKDYKDSSDTSPIGVNTKYLYQSKW